MLRGSGLPDKLDHADQLGRQLEQDSPGEASVALSLTGDVFQHSSTWARRQLDIPLGVEG